MVSELGDVAAVAVLVSKAACVRSTCQAWGIALVRAVMQVYNALMVASRGMWATAFRLAGQCCRRDTRAVLSECSTAADVWR